MGAAEVEAFLTHLAVAKRVSASMRNQAKSAVLFLYKQVLGEALPWLEGIESAKRPARPIRTEQAYEHWGCRFIAFCRNRDPLELPRRRSGGPH